MKNDYINVCACNKCKEDLEAYEQYKLLNPMPPTIPDNYFTMAWEVRSAIKFNRVSQFKGGKRG